MSRLGLGSGLVAVLASVFALTGCAGEEAAAGAQPLTNVVPEAIGANCAEGGQAIQMGVDVNGTGQLEADEVTATSYVCNGTTKKIEPVISQIPVGDPRCANGGTLLSFDGKDVVACNGAQGEKGAEGAKGDQGEKGDQGIQGIQGIQGAKGDKGDPGVLPVEPKPGKFFSTQIVGGGLLTCTGVAEKATTVRCEGMKLNGVDVYLGSKEANVICAAVTGKEYDFAGGLGLASSSVTWNGAGWVTGGGNVSPMNYIECKR